MSLSFTFTNPPEDEKKTKSVAAGIRQRRIQCFRGANFLHIATPWPSSSFSIFRSRALLPARLPPDPSPPAFEVPTGQYFAAEPSAPVQFPYRLCHLVDLAQRLLKPAPHCPQFLRHLRVPSSIAIRVISILVSGLSTMSSAMPVSEEWGAPSLYCSSSPSLILPLPFSAISYRCQKEQSRVSPYTAGSTAWRPLLDVCSSAQLMTKGIIRLGAAETTGVVCVICTPHARTYAYRKTYIRSDLPILLYVLNTYSLSSLRSPREYSAFAVCVNIEC